MSKKGLSVISPVLNEEFFLPSYLEAVCQYADEVLLLDGGSRDRSIEIIKEFQRKKNIDIHLWQINQKGRPYTDDWQEGKRRNFLLERASYDWVLILDIDEFLSDNFKEVFENNVLQNQTVPLYGFKFIPFWRDINTVRINSPDDLHWEGDIYRLIRKETASYNCQGNHSHLLCRGIYPWQLRKKVLLKEVILYHYHYALGPKIKTNDNRRGDVNCLEDGALPDWDYQPDVYQIKTREFKGKHPFVIRKLLARGD